MRGNINLNRIRAAIMSWNNQLPGIGFWRAVRQYGCLALLVASVLLATWCAVFLIRASDLGPELSDSAFYILMHRAHAEVLATLSGFGLLMQALAGDSSIQNMRLATMLALFATPSLLLWVVGRDSGIISTGQTGPGMSRATPDRGISLVWAGAVIVAGCSSFAFYKWLLLDPNYNVLILPCLYLCALGLWRVWGEITSPDAPRWPWLGAGASLAGSALFCLALLKISAAIVFTVIALPVITLAILATPDLRRRRAAGHLGAAILLSLPGMVAVLGLIWLRVLPPDDLWSRFKAGYEVMQLMNAHETSLAGHLSDLMRNLDLLGTALQNNGLWIGPAAICILLSLIWPGRDVPPALGSIACLALLTGAVLNHSDFAAMARLTWVFALLVSTLSLFTRPSARRPTVFAVVFAWAPYGLSFGTATGIVGHAAIFSGAAVTAIFLSAVALRSMRPVLVIAGMILGAATVLSAVSLAADKPYRMGGQLSQATEQVQVRGETFRVTPAVAGTYRAVSAMRQTPAWAARKGRPILIDMTGRAPLLHWLGDFRVPGIAWILSGYPGSEALLEWALVRIKDADLADIWIVIDAPDAEGTRKGLPIAPLDARLAKAGLAFPRDYVRIGPLVPIAYIGREAWMYAPRHLVDNPAQNRP